MEIGNALFCNSRGKYPIRSREDWELVLAALDKALLQYTGYGINETEFENDVFSVFP